MFWPTIAPGVCRHAAAGAKRPPYWPVPRPLRSFSSPFAPPPPPLPLTGAMVAGSGQGTTARRGRMALTTVHESTPKMGVSVAQMLRVVWGGRGRSFSVAG